MSIAHWDCDVRDLQSRLPSLVALQCVRHSGEIEAASLNWLSVEERLRLYSFRSGKRRREFLLGRAAARLLLARHLACLESEVTITVGEEGAPRIPHPGLRLSIAHARDLAAAAIFGNPVGVDIEPIIPRRPDLYRYLLHPDEYVVLENTQLPHNDAQILLWSLKEAVLKARRSGFQLSPKRLRVSVDPEAKRANVTVESEEHWDLVYDEVDHHFLAVATPKVAR